MNKLLAIGIALLLPTSPIFAQDETIDAFLYSHQLDDFTDEDRSFIVTFDEDEEGALVWRCLADGLNVLLNVGKYMGGDSDDDIRVRYRFDRNEASGFQYWRLFPGQNEIAYMGMSNVDEFTEEALDATQVVIEAVDPLDGESRRLRMSLKGLTKAITRLTCAQDFH